MIIRNAISKLPEGIGACVALTELSAVRNSLVEVADDLTKCVALKSLDLSDNAITSIPQTIGYLNHIFY